MAAARRRRDGLWEPKIPRIAQTSFPASKFNGIEIGRQIAPPGSASSTIFFDGKSRSYSVSVVEAGLAVAVCERRDN
jgi:hypothetical protein